MNILSYTMEHDVEGFLNYFISKNARVTSLSRVDRLIEKAKYPMITSDGEKLFLIQFSSCAEKKSRMRANIGDIFFVIY